MRSEGRGGYGLDIVYERIKLYISQKNKNKKKVQIKTIPIDDVF